MERASKEKNLYQCARSAHCIGSAEEVAAWARKALPVTARNSLKVSKECGNSISKGRKGNGVLNQKKESSSRPNSDDKCQSAMKEWRSLTDLPGQLKNRNPSAITGSNKEEERNVYKSKRKQQEVLTIGKDFTTYVKVANQRERQVEV